MSYIEYAFYELDYNDQEAKQAIENAIAYSVDCICVPFAYTKYCKTLIKDNKIKIANAIDYPLGLLDSKTRKEAIINAIDNGAEKICIVLQNNYLNLKKYDKIRQDIKLAYDICSERNISISYYLEYRIFTHQSLIKACNILMETPVDTVYVSTGYMLDNVEDNIIASVLLREKTGIKTIFSTNIWTKKHVELLIKNKIDYLRFSHISSLSLYKSHIS
jgi:deoxyribose-phosphate aldolase